VGTCYYQHSARNTVIRRKMLEILVDEFGSQPDVKGQGVCLLVEI
jgi:hypothetical protein